MRIVGAPLSLARVAESADAYGSGPYGATRGGSSPLASTPFFRSCGAEFISTHEHTPSLLSARAKLVMPVRLGPFLTRFAGGFTEIKEICRGWRGQH